VAPPEKLLTVARQLVNHPFALTSFARIANRLGPHWESFDAMGDPLRMVNAVIGELSRHLPEPERSRVLLKRAAIFLEDAPVAALAWLSRWDPDDEIQSDAEIVKQAITLADWNVVSWNAEALTIHLHTLVKDYFKNLFDVSELRLAHARIATWYRVKNWNPDGASLDNASCIFFSLKHALLGDQVSRAVAVMFDPQGTWPSPYDWLVSRGHLSECVELVSEIAEKTQELTRAQCLLAKFNALHRLDLLARAGGELDEATELFEKALSSGEPTLVGGLARCYAFKGNLSLDTEKVRLARDFYDHAIGNIPFFRKDWLVAERFNKDF
jgi:tetratricopeptide (TPR) repeat protein